MAVDGPPIFFFHIPKTGGSSLRSALQSATKGHLLERDFVSAREAIGCSTPATSLAGHLSVLSGEWEAIRERFLTLTILRDPARRLISQYFQFRRGNALERLPIEQSDGSVLSLMGFLESKLSDPTDTDRHIYSSWLAQLAWDGNGMLMPAQRQSLAMEALASFDLVGITDDLDGLMKRLAHWLPDTPKTTPQLNLTPAEHRSEITPQALELAERITAEDRDLYLKAKSLSRPRRLPKKLGKNPESSGPLPAVEFGSRDVEILGVDIRSSGKSSDEPMVECGEAFEMVVAVRCHRDNHDLTLGLGISDRWDRLVFGTNSTLLGHPLTLRAGTDTRHTFLIYADLGPGEYDVSITAHSGLNHFEGCFHWKTHALRLFVRHSRRLPGFAGITYLKTRFCSGNRASMPLLPSNSASPP